VVERTQLLPRQVRQDLFELHLAQPLRLRTLVNLGRPRRLLACGVPPHPGLVRLWSTSHHKIRNNWSSNFLTSSAKIHKTTGAA
jgi:hypothetical protein